MPSFCHLHVHTKYSLLDGLCKTEELLARAKELGQPAIAITDHGNLFGVIEFYKCAKKMGVKPIIGCEVYVAPASRFDRGGTGVNYHHLILLAENNIGYHHLMKLVSYSYLEGHYYKPRVDYELLEKYKEGLICLTACMFGEFSQALLNRSEKEAKEVLLRLKEIFGEDHLFVELQNHHLPEQKQILPQQIQLAKACDLPMVATNDVHYIHRQDAFYQEILMCIQMQKTIADEDRIRFDSEELYLKSYEEMHQLFSHVPEALENTVKIAKRCNVDFTFGEYHLPKFQPPSGTSPKEYLKELCLEGLQNRYGLDGEKHVSRLTEELDTINTMGFTDYFLICHDFIRYARMKGIPVGPGRGSAAGSLVAYCLYITNLDPIQYNLIFERFLNMERITMPDIDIDFCYERRGEVIDYVINKYGADKVSQIITFGTLGAKQAVRDVGRALAVPYQDVDMVAKLIPFELNITLADALKNTPDLKELYEEDNQVKTLLDIAMRVEGLPRHCSTHAAGVVITNEPLMEYVPLYKSDDVVSTQFTMNTLEELGLLKMDFLGLRNLTVIADTVKLVEQNTGIQLDMDQIDYGDWEVLSQFHSGDTDGVFQFESFGMRRFLREFRPESLEDLILAVSIYRPGPMQEIPNLLRNKAHPEKITYEAEALSEILSVTYGCMVYQEQVMEIFRKLAGYTMGKADIVRRAMSKKKMDVLLKEQQIFTEGCERNGIPKENAQRIFHKIQEFAKYAFNKSHAACYAYVAYQTAFLKYYHKAEFMAALMTSFIDNQNKVIQYIKTCEQLGIQVAPPSVNRSMETFSTQNGKILFGLSAIKNVGFQLTHSIVEERNEHGDFTTLDDFLIRMSKRELNKRAVESLIKAGALDDLGDRIDLLRNYEISMDYIQNQIRSNVPGQLSLFDQPVMEERKSPYQSSVPRNENSSKQYMRMEKEVLGIYLSANPLSNYQEAIARTANGYSYEISSVSQDNVDSRLREGDAVTVVGMIQNKKVRTTKKGQQMALFTLEDLYGEIPVIVFPGQFAAHAPLITEENLVVLKGEIAANENEDPKLILRELALFHPDVSTEKLYLRLMNREILREVTKILKEHSGNTPVYVYFNDTRQNTVAKKDLWVLLSKTLVSRLRLLIGEENVKIVP